VDLKRTQVNLNHFQINKWKQIWEVWIQEWVNLTQWLLNNSKK
jgi:hypothetical protein